MADPKRQSNPSLSVSHLFIHSVVILFALAILINPAASVQSPNGNSLPSLIRTHSWLDKIDCRKRKVEIINNYFWNLFTETEDDVSLIDYNCLRLMKKNKEWFRSSVWGTVGDRGAKLDALVATFNELENQDEEIFWTAAIYFYFYSLRAYDINGVLRTAPILLSKLHARFIPLIGELSKKTANPIGDDQQRLEEMKEEVKKFQPILIEALSKGEEVSKSEMVNRALKNCFKFFFPGALDLSETADPWFPLW